MNIKTKDWRPIWSRVFRNGDEDLSGSKGVYVLDNFTDADGVLIENHTMDLGDGWTKIGNTAHIASNEYGEVAFSSEYHTPFVLSDSRIAMSMLAKTGGACSLLGRIQDENNCWSLTARLYDNTIRLEEVVAGAFTLRDSAPAGLVDGVYYVVTFEFDGTSIKGYIDGVEKVSYTSATWQNETGLGVYTYKVADKIDWVRGAAVWYEL